MQRAMIVLLIAVLAMLVRWQPAPRAAVSIEEQFKYGSVGTEDATGIPYWIWQVLPRMFADKLPGPGGYGSLGIVWEQGRELPVGFSARSVWGVSRVGVNCAFCHTASVRTSAAVPATLVLGGPSHQTNPQAFSRFLEAAASDSRFNPTDVMAAIGQMTRLSWFDSAMYRFALIPAVKRGLVQHHEQFAWMNTRPAWGRGRIDPQNPFKYTTLHQPIDQTIGNSDMTPLWNMKARQGMALHWDGMNTSFREVVLSSAIGNGATTKSIDLEALDRLGRWFEDLQPPAFPFPVSQAAVQQGRGVYDRACASCHGRGGARTGTVIPIDEIGTDRHRLDTWTQASADAFNAFAHGQDWQFSHFRKTNGYVAVPLDGVWLRAPYLHNGSVPSLADLLEPEERRARLFYRGYDVFDPVRVGFVSSGGEGAAVATKYDVREPGNGNGGHRYGTTLLDAEKQSLIEFLKTR